MRYGIHTRLRRGRRISAFFTMRCPLQCYYCSLRSGGDFPKYPHDKTKEMNLDQWKLLMFNLFKFMPIREIYVTGGEPTLRDDLSAFVNFLLDQGKCVTVHSNLWTEKGMGIKPTNRFRWMVTYHHSDKEERFLNIYEKYANKYRVDVHEIDEKKIAVSKKITDFETQGPEISGRTDRFAISPDGYIFVQMERFYEHLSR